MTNVRQVHFTEPSLRRILEGMVNGECHTEQPNAHKKPTPTHTHAALKNASKKVDGISITANNDPLTTTTASRDK